jgi:hypothetical protein
LILEVARGMVSGAGHAFDPQSCRASAFLANAVDLFSGRIERSSTPRRHPLKLSIHRYPVAFVPIEPFEVHWRSFPPVISA